MNFAQKIYRQIRFRQLLPIAQGVPIINLILMPRFNKYSFGKLFLIILCGVPLFGLARRPYIKKKFNKSLHFKTEADELELKESITKFDIHIPYGMEYMIIVALNQHSQFEENGFHKVDKEHCRKVFNLLQEAENSQQSAEIKWAFLGSQRLYEVIEGSRNSKKFLALQFHENQTMKRQAKVYLLARDAQNQEKIMMEWNAGVPFKEISKYIAKLKYKKYLREINF